MEPIDFWKMNGSGNDFILINNMDGKIKNDEMKDLVTKISRRRESVGADGVIFLEKSAHLDFAWRFFNADGTEVEMCGNGSRCIARFAYLLGIADREMSFETMAGPVSASVHGRMVKVLMPLPKDFSRDIAIKHRGLWEGVDFINTGVPHVVVYVNDLETYPVLEHGRSIRYDPFFAPDGTNVNFMRVLAPYRIEVRTYERGVEDETFACGTGSIACALAASKRGLARSPVKVMTRGGDQLVIYFTPADCKQNQTEKKHAMFKEVWLEGNTSIVYKGQLHEEALLTVSNTT